MRKAKDFLKTLIDANSSASSRAFFMLVVLAIACVLLCIVGFILMYDCLYDGRIDTDLTGLSTLVGAIGASLGVAGLTKSIGNRNNNEE